MSARGGRRRIASGPLSWACLAAVGWSGCSIYTEELLSDSRTDEAAAPPLSASSGGQADVAARTGGTSNMGVGGQPPTSGGAFLSMGGVPPVEPPFDPCTLRAGEHLLADFEEGVTNLALSSGRSASWFQFNDGSGTQLPEKPASGPMLAEALGACQTGYGFKTSGTNFTSWGAGVGFDLLPKIGGEKQPDDLSGYSGFAFFARAVGSVVLRVSWSDENTAEEGKKCDPDARPDDDDRCGDYFGKDLLLSDEWTRYEVSFSELRQRGFGLQVPEGFERAEVYTFRAQTGGQESFEFSLDELTLIPE